MSKSRSIAVALALVACGRSEPAPSEPTTPAVASAAEPTVIAATTRELLLAIVDDWTATTATLRRYRRDGGAWQPIGAPWPAVVGRTGTAWGDGLHGRGAPRGRTGPVKREGDGKSPAGAFALGRSYGYAPAAPAGAKRAYTPVSEPWKCVDDPASRHYATIVDRRVVTMDWTSAEDMRRADELYAWTIDVAHNPARVPRGGSCIFLHVWSGAASTTAGCTAMDAQILEALVRELDPQTVYVVLPSAEYGALAARWGLPRL